MQSVKVENQLSNVSMRLSFIDLESKSIVSLLQTNYSVKKWSVKGFSVAKGLYRVLSVIDN